MEDNAAIENLVGRLKEFVFYGKDNDFSLAQLDSQLLQSLMVIREKVNTEAVQRNDSGYTPFSPTLSMPMEVSRDKQVLIDTSPASPSPATVGFHSIHPFATPG